MCDYRVIFLLPTSILPVSLYFCWLSSDFFFFFLATQNIVMQLNVSIFNIMVSGCYAIFGIDFCPCIKRQLFRSLSVLLWFHILYLNIWASVIVAKTALMINFIFPNI